MWDQTDEGEFSHLFLIVLTPYVLLSAVLLILIYLLTFVLRRCVKVVQSVCVPAMINCVDTLLASPDCR